VSSLGLLTSGGSRGPVRRGVLVADTRRPRSGIRGIAGKLGIPAADLRRLREQRPALYGGSVNGWLGGDDRRFLVRCLRGDGSGGASVMAAGGREPR
jgi:hypothetical protein